MVADAGDADGEYEQEAEQCFEAVPCAGGGRGHGCPVMCLTWAFAFG